MLSPLATSSVSARSFSKWSGTGDASEATADLRQDAAAETEGEHPMQIVSMSV